MKQDWGNKSVHEPRRGKRSTCPQNQKPEKRIGSCTREKWQIHLLVIPHGGMNTRTETDYGRTLRSQEVTSRETTRLKGLSWERRIPELVEKRHQPLSVPSALNPTEPPFTTSSGGGRSHEEEEEEISIGDEKQNWRKARRPMMSSLHWPPRVAIIHLRVNELEIYKDDTILLIAKDSFCSLFLRIFLQLLSSVTGIEN